MRNSRALQATASVLLAVVLGNSVHVSPSPLHPEQEAALNALGVTDDTNNIAPIAMTEGFSQALFDELVVPPARRLVDKRGWYCVAVGQVPALSVVQVRGVFEQFEFWGGGDMVEPKAQVAAIAAEDGGQAVGYVSTDGGATGFTVLMGIRAKTKSAPLRRMPAGGAYPSPDATPCGRFEATSGLSASVQRAVEAETSWSWTAADGNIVKFTFDNGSLIHESSASVMPSLYFELQAALRKSLGVRPWAETYFTKTKPEWTPTSRALWGTTFEGSNGQQIHLRTGQVSGKVLLRLAYEQQPAGTR